MPKRRRERRIPLDTQFTLWLEFELWVPMPELGPDVNAFDPENDGCNIQITLDNGEVYALNVWTYKLVERLTLNDRQTGENLGGKYLEPPDLFVERLDRQLFTEVVADLIRRDSLSEAWRAVTFDDSLDDTE